MVHGASSAGDALVVVALSGTLFFSVAASAARAKVGLYLLLAIAPYAVLAPLVGPLVDRHRGARRAAILVATAGRAVLCLWLASITASGWLYPGAFALLVMSRAYGVARSALVPALRGARPGGGTGSLVSANARLSVVAVLSGAAASAPGIALLRIFSGGAVLRLAAVAYAAATAFAFPLPKPEGEADEIRSAAAAFSTPALRRAARAAAAARALGGFLLFALAFSLKREGASSLGYGFVLGCTALGAFGASLAVPRLRRGGSEEWVILASLAAASAAALLGAREFGLGAAAAVAGVAGLAGAGIRLAFASLVQREAHEAVRGRAFARYETLFQLAWALGAAVPVAIPMGGRGALAAAGAGFAASALSFAVSERRRGGH
ncbi:MAG: MFS transporter [Acidobacteria bacterium]|nr:MFS transporter [Acidobacteriota bacterium]